MLSWLLYVGGVLDTLLCVLVDTRMDRAADATLMRV
jgi:hypothetical protein